VQSFFSLPDSGPKSWWQGRTLQTKVVDTNSCRHCFSLPQTREPHMIQPQTKQPQPHIKKRQCPQKKRAATKESASEADAEVFSNFTNNETE